MGSQFKTMMIMINPSSGSNPCVF